MNEKKKYMVFRVYSKKERPDSTDQERVVFFGWTKSKTVLKAFKEQRDQKKYIIRKMDEEDIAERFSEDITDTDTMIDFIKLKSVHTQEDVIFFSTANELKTAEINIQRMMKDLCSVSDIPGDGPYLWMVLALEDHYGDALHYLGYRPPEIDIIFPCMDSESHFDEYENEIETAYDGLMIPPEEVVTKNINPLGLMTLSDVSSKILYSLESFIKVLKDDL